MPTRATPRMPAVQRRRASVLLICMICIGWLLAGCGQGASATLRTTAATRAPTAVAMPTPTTTPVVRILQASGPPIAGRTLHWQHANLPTGFGMVFHESDLRVSASDGATAYACAAPNGAAHPQVVVTHNAGATWTRAADIPAAWGQCPFLVVDALDPAIVVADSGMVTNITPQAISTDSGASWQLTSNAPVYSILQPATVGSRTYAILLQSDANGDSNTLGVSDDHLKTWHAIDTGISDRNYRSLWVNPSTGAILLETESALWSTDDGGQRWSRLQFPIPVWDDIVVQQPTAGKRLWHLCESSSSATTNGVRIMCTADGGKTWTQEPALALANSAVYGEAVVGIAKDDSLLAYTTSSSQTLFRLPYGATRWQLLGALPTTSTGGIIYSPYGSDGTLWTLPAESDGASTPDPANAVYAAACPF